MRYSIKFFAHRYIKGIKMIRVAILSLIMLQSLIGCESKENTPTENSGVAGEQDRGQERGQEREQDRGQEREQDRGQEREQEREPMYELPDQVSNQEELLQVYQILFDVICQSRCLTGDVGYDECTSILEMTYYDFAFDVSLNGLLSGRLEFKREALECVLESYRTNRCDSAQVCERGVAFLLGTVPEGGVCMLDLDCAQDPLQEAKCEGGSSVVNECGVGVCVISDAIDNSAAFAYEGERCGQEVVINEEMLAVECYGGLSCDDGQCVIFMPRAEGEVCDGVGRGNCRRGLHCLTQRDMVKVCTPLFEMGESCDAPGALCESGAYCQAEGRAQVCRPRHQEGAECTLFSCAAGLKCIESVCLPKVLPGEACALTGQCHGMNTECIEGVCAWACE